MLVRKVLMCKHVFLAWDCHNSRITSRFAETFCVRLRNSIIGFSLIIIYFWLVHRLHLPQKEIGDLPLEPVVNEWWNDLYQYIYSRANRYQTWSFPIANIANILARFQRIAQESLPWSTFINLNYRGSVAILLKDEIRHVIPRLHHAAFAAYIGHK